jgi:hypothetical protein
VTACQGQIVQGSDKVSSGFVLACALRTLDLGELVDYTRALIAAGTQLQFGPGPVADKHCIGGIPGNRTTLIVVPILAALRVCIPKTSSRAITSPAGTADTMSVLAEVALPPAHIRCVVQEARACIAWGGALELAPADDILITVERALSGRPTPGDDRHRTVPGWLPCCPIDPGLWGSGNGVTSDCHCAGSPRDSCRGVLSGDGGGTCRRPHPGDRLLGNCPGGEARRSTLRLWALGSDSMPCHVEAWREPPRGGGRAQKTTHTPHAANQRESFEVQRGSSWRWSSWAGFNLCQGTADALGSRAVRLGLHVGEGVEGASVKRQANEGALIGTREGKHTSTAYAFLPTSSSTSLRRAAPRAVPRHCPRSSCRARCITVPSRARENGFSRNA